ncbi:hypothetical protein LCFBJUUZ_CDS0086 [Staphylococcus phage PG-2021_76]
MDTNDIIDWLKDNTDFKVGNMKVAIGLENGTNKLVNIKQPYNSDKVTVLQKTVIYGVGKGHDFVVPSLTIESISENYTLKMYGVGVLKNTTLEDIKDYIEGSQYHNSKFKKDPLQGEYRG